MSDQDFDDDWAWFDDEPALASREVLDAWAVPAPAPHLADRIADAWRHERTAGARPRRRFARLDLAWGALAAVAAAILILLLSYDAVRNPEPQQPIAVSTQPSVVDDFFPPPVMLELTVVPDDATVTIERDGQIIASVRGDARIPLPVSDDETYTVRARADGYAEVEHALRPTAGRDQALHVVLPPQNGEDQDPERATPRPHDDLVEILRKLERSASLERAIEVVEQRAAAGESEAKSEPKPKPKPKPKTTTNDDEAETARLHVGTNPGVPPAKVFIDGRFVGRTPLMRIEVTAGLHEVKFAWSDGKTVVRRIFARAGSTQIIKAG